MQNIRVLFAALVLSSFVLAIVAPAAEPAKQPQGKIRVLLVTGGHAFEKEPFFKLFKDNPDITYQAVEHPNAYAMLKAEAASQYDVIVTYDLWPADHRRSEGGFCGAA